MTCSSSDVRRRRATLVVAAVVAALAACDAPPPDVTLPERSPMLGDALVARVEFAYVRLFAEPRYDALILGIARGGDVLDVVTTTTGGDWLLVTTPFATGWIDGADARLFASRRQAEGER